MPQVKLKGISLEKTIEISSEISTLVSSLISVPKEHIVVEHIDVTLVRNGIVDNDTTMVEILWKARPFELKVLVARELAKFLQENGLKTVEVIYTDLDMNDFFEYKI